MSVLTCMASARAARIRAGRVSLAGWLAWPSHPSGVVVLAHTLGASTPDQQDDRLASHLRAAGLATFQFDLITAAEATNRARAFAILPLAKRLLAGMEWVVFQPETTGLSLGLCGAGSCAAVALAAAAMAPDAVGAVVSRAGRTDLAAAHLSHVRAPTLLLVGGRDTAGIARDRKTIDQLAGPKQLELVPGAGLLFEEPGTLDCASKWAASWFVRYLAMEPTWHHLAAFTVTPALARGGLHVS